MLNLDADMLLIIDNYDSFTYNLVQYFAELGAAVKVARNDQISLDAIRAMAPQYLVISPGPCTPNKAGIAVEAIQTFAGKIPILGVCLGHQSIAQAFGGTIIRATHIMHGKTSLIRHQGDALFDGVAQPLTATRYHSLVVRRDDFPACLNITAWTDDEDNEIMGLQHDTLPVFGVQFHPESILTECGHQLLQNFLDQA